MSIKDITVIITTFKSDEKIKDCLRSINKSASVIIVENSDNIQFKKNIEKEFSNVKCMLTGANLGYGRANNIGLKTVKTKYALILNPDATLSSSTLDNFFKTTLNISNFAIMAPYIQEKNKNKENVTTPIEVDNVKGFAMFLNMSEFENVGFFDENFFIYFEEIDLCRRLINSNKKIFLVPSIKINHDGGQSHVSSVNKEMELSRNWHWMWSTFNYHKKYKGFLLSLLLVMPKFLSALIKFLLYSVLFKKEKKEIYYHRFSGLINSIFGKKSWYRPKV